MHCYLPELVCALSLHGSWGACCSDEWFTLRRLNATKQLPRSIPDFLDRKLPEHVASLQLDSYAFPAQCATSGHGDYVSRFTLRKRNVWENMQKVRRHCTKGTCACVPCETTK